MVGILLAVLLGAVGLLGLGISLPLSFDSLTLLTAGGLCITGNLLCIIRTCRRSKDGEPA